MRLNSISKVFATLLAASVVTRSAQAVSFLTVDGRRNCLDVNHGGYPPGGGPVSLAGLAKGKYVIEVVSSTVRFNCGADPCPAREAVLWYGSRVAGSETWYQTVRAGQPVVIDYNPENGAPEFRLQAFVLDTFCTNNTGSAILSVRQVAP